MAKPIVAVIKTKPAGVLDDIEKVMQSAGMKDFLPKDGETILKDNISWHFPYLSANTTPWQARGGDPCAQGRGVREHCRRAQ